MQLENVQIKKLKLAAYNPRKISDRELKKLVTSIEENGFVQPILINKDYTIIGGHQRVKAAKQLAMDELPCLMIDVDKTKEKELNLALNKISGAWDDTALLELLKDLDDTGSLYKTGFDTREMERLEFKAGNKINRKLQQDYIVPPFSIFDTKQAYWQGRKKEWIEQIGDGNDGRAEDMIEGMERIGNLAGGKTISGTSLFDPVLTEVIYTWYANKGATIIDPFAGGITRGAIAGILGYKYVGTDLNGKQIDSNKEAAKARGIKGVDWHEDNGSNLQKHAKEGAAELLFTCPPYYDLEKYTDHPDDLSKKETYADFLVDYREILKRTYPLLKANGWAVIVVANVRDKEGVYYNLVGDTITAMQDAGYSFYNEIILATSLATATLRARKTFDAAKKVTKTHQNILFFTKGKEVKINNALRDVLMDGRTAIAHHDVLVFKK